MAVDKKAVVAGGTATAVGGTVVGGAALYAIAAELEDQLRAAMRTMQTEAFELIEAKQGKAEAALQAAVEEDIAEDLAECVPGIGSMLEGIADCIDPND